jgi:hypothetical protein
MNEEVLELSELDAPTGSRRISDAATEEPRPSDEVEPSVADRFKEQKMAACRPFMTPIIAMIVYASFTVVSIILGVVFYYASGHIEEIRIPYDSPDPVINRSFTVPIDLAGPVYIYYEISNLYQKVFIYSRSICWNQLLGRPSTDTELKSACRPQVRDANNSYYVPCGAVARSVFNDSFVFPDFPPITSKGIASPRFHALFTAPDAMYDDDDQWLDRELFPEGQRSERLVNWIELATWRTFKKLWAKTENDVIIPAGNYSVLISNRFQVNSFGGTKVIVITTVSWIGGKNSFFAILFIVIAAASGLAAFVFLGVHCCHLMPLYRPEVGSRTQLDMPLVK